MATLEAARDAARNAGNGPHRIVVMAGDYFLVTPLELDERDNSLTIEGELRGGATLYGGKPVSGWRRDGDFFWCADLPGVKEGLCDFRTLIVNGRLAERACLPGTGTFEHQGTWNQPMLPAVAGRWERNPTLEELTTMPYDPKDIPAALDARSAEVRMYHMLNESIVGISKNDTKRHVLILSQATVNPIGALNRKQYVILNTREGMTRPGQWYLDRTAGRVVYWPLPGEDLSKIEIIAPATKRVIHIAGSSRRVAEMITIRNLAFQATSTPLKSPGFGGGSLDGALSIENARQCKIEDIEICNVGGGGIRGYNLNECQILHCHIHHTGAGGIIITNSADINVSKNHIHHVGIYYSSAAGATMFRGENIHIHSNIIHDAPYSGIICGGKNYLIEQNLIYQVMRELHDGAGIYGTMRNCTIRDNFVRDVVKVGEGFGVSAFYLDGGSRDCVVEHNVAQGVAMPVVTCAVGGLADIFRDGEMGALVPVRNAEAIANKIERMISDRNAMVRMARYNHAYAKENFLAPKVAARLLDIYRETIACGI